MSESYDMEVVMNMLDQLETLGLNGRQAKVYLYLLQSGPVGAIEIAKGTTLKHPTVYDVLDVLKSRRLVSESTVGGRKVFAPENPDQLRLSEDRRRHALDSLLPDLQTLYQSNHRRPRIRIYEGNECAGVIDDQLLGVESKEYFYFGSVREMHQLHSESALREYYRRRLERGIWSYAIRVHGPEETFDYMENGERHLRKVRYLPKPILEDVAGLYLYDGKVAILSARNESYAMIIESRELFSLLIAVWRCMWEIAIPAEERSPE